MADTLSSILVCTDERTIAHLEAQGIDLVIARTEDAAFDAVRAHPRVPVLVDVGDFPDWPKQLRKRSGGDLDPGLVIGFAAPTRHDLMEHAETFCDEVAPRPEVMRRLPELLATRTR